MKAAIIIAASAAVAFAQNASLPECGATCINNMILKIQAPPYNCPNDAGCFCCQADFGYGIRDCSYENCGNEELANSAVSYAASYCASALSTSSICAMYTSAVSGSATASLTGSASGQATIVPLAAGASGYSIASTTLTAGGPDVTKAGVEYTVLPNGDVVATASSMTITYASSAILAAYTGSAMLASSSASGSGVLLGTGGSGSAVMPSASNSAGSSTGSGSMSGSMGTSTGGMSTGGMSTGGAGGSSPSSSSTALAPMITAAPAFVGAAALAILAL